MRQIGEYFFYVSNQLYAPIFPAHAVLRAKGAKGAKGVAARKTPAAGGKTGVTAVAAIVA